MTDVRIFVNDKPVVLLRGMTVKHALVNAGVAITPESHKRVYDEWGNEVGLDGALAGGMKIYVR